MPVHVAESPVQKSKHDQQKRSCSPTLPQSQAFFHTIQNRTSFRRTEGQALEMGGSAHKLISILQHFSQRKTSILGQRQYLDFEKHKSEPCQINILNNIRKLQLF